MKIRWLIFGLILLAALGSIPVIAQTSKTKESNLKTNLKKINGKKADLRKKITATKRQASYVLSDIAKVDNQLGTIESDIDDSRDKIRRLERENVQLTKDLVAAENELKKQTIVVKARIRRLYMQPEGTALGALLSSDSLADLASRKTIFNNIAEKDHEAFAKYTEACQVVRTKKKRKEAVIAETHQLVAKLKDREEELHKHRQTKKGLLVELQGQTSELMDQWADLEKESNAIEAQLAQYQAKSTGGPVFGGRFIMPARGRITSGFGSRMHPILHTRRMHTGIDIGASYGSTIVAAGSGTVVSAGYRNGYGNTVIIDHGGGVATLYGHCSRLFVSEGQHVNQGQKIAAVGSTGLSTGPHCHFEVRINGKPVDPRGRL